MKVSVGDPAGTATGVTAAESRLVELPDHSVGLPVRPGASLTLAQSSGNGARVVAPLKVTSLSCPPRRKPAPLPRRPT